jgi:hypothetical protein
VLNDRVLLGTPLKTSVLIKDKADFGSKELSTTVLATLDDHISLPTCTSTDIGAGRMKGKYTA